MAALDSGSRFPTPTRSVTPTVRRLELDNDDVPVPHTRVRVDGVFFDSLDETQVVDHIFRSLAEARGGSVITPNVDILRQLRTDDLCHLTDEAELVVPDGMPIIWASKLQGQQLPERVTGSSLIWSLARRAAGVGSSLFLLGGAEGIAERAAGRLTEDIEGLEITGWYCPPFGFEGQPDQLNETIDAVVEAKPDIVFVALGFPKQENLMKLLREYLPGTWFIGCGGGLTMAAGEVERAPEWIQRSGFEWVHRLAKEPRRMAKRYLIDDLPYAAGLMARSIRARVRSHTAGSV